jgi:hypothetical protein
MVLLGLFELAQVIGGVLVVVFGIGVLLAAVIYTYWWVLDELLKLFDAKKSFLQFVAEKRRKARVTPRADEQNQRAGEYQASKP